MNFDRPPSDVPATSEYVLEVIRDHYRQVSQFDEGTEPGAELTFKTSIGEWQQVCDLVGWRDLGRALSEEWKIEREEWEWRAVLTPAWTRTLGELCEFIARDARMPVIEPVTILGSSCRAAGAFLAIRSSLKDAGEDVDPIGPSTPLDLYTRRHLDVFLWQVSRFAPGRLPEIRLSTPVHDRFSLAFVLSMMFAFGGSVFSPILSGIGGVLALFCFTLSWFSARRILPSKADFGDLRTFRDMARAIAGPTNPVEGST